MRLRFSFWLVLSLLALLSLGCGGGGSNPATTMSVTQSGTVFLTGSDAPIPSVLAFQITIDSLTLSDGNNSVAVISSPTTVEFSRLLGLRTLLALNSVPVGRYSSATITLSSPIISYLDLTTTPASVSTIPNPTLTQSTLTVPLDPALLVSQNGLGGLHMDFRLRESLQLDAGGQITGVVNPVIRVRALRPEDDDNHIDELRGGLSSVNVAAGSFVLQRPNGRQFTIVVSQQTQFEGTDGLTSMVPPAIVEVSGRVQADGSILAQNVEVITTERALAGGLVLNTDPASGPANTITLLVREEIPDLEGIQVGRPATLNLDANAEFRIHYLDIPVASMLFNRESMVIGQRIAVGGFIDTSSGPATLVARRVILHRQGLEGRAVSGSVVIVNGNQGHFLLNNQGFWGYLFGGPLRVRSTEFTRYRNLSGLSAIDPNLPLRVMGLLLRDPNGDPVLVAGLIERLEP